MPLILLDYLLSNTIVYTQRNAHITLMDLALGLLGCSKNVKFLKRDDVFHGVFRVLAPFPDDVEKSAGSLFKNFDPSPTAPLFWDYLTKFSNALCVCLTAENGSDAGRFQERIYYILKSYRMEDDVTAVINRQYQDLYDSLSENKTLKKQLNKLGHLINIIFQSNTDVPNKNVLFTGDAERDVMIKIDKNNEFYKAYALYKTPHHGTKKHYYIPSTVRFIEKEIISNGKKAPPNTKIDKAYCNLLISPPILYCTNCNNCEQYPQNPQIPRYCGIHYNILVYPKDSELFSVP